MFLCSNKGKDDAHQVECLRWKTHVCLMPPGRTIFAIQDNQPIYKFCAFCFDIWSSMILSEFYLPALMHPIFFYGAFWILCTSCRSFPLVRKQLCACSSPFFYIINHVPAGYYSIIQISFYIF